ncbi:protein of unknown function [Rhizobium sp. NFR07]|uniref:DUF4405 domain-containing protein n=1 Tax=Rhizobium sp. NFR07 TaxID=1566262 RepID=UPI0008F2D672|nr:DUF4405 domain-containing protein [Rhizobium sp. NFR07]SFB34385.1 protein of unknown function [Rhizobium sp. NFR07]
MNVIFRVRLLLDLIAVGLIIACLAYWWLDNLTHELFGTALFALVIAHNIFNRRWYGGLKRRKLDATRIVNLSAITGLAVVMTIMLVTSVLISRELFPFAALDGAFAVREIHMFAAYWVLLIIAIHLGTRWQVVMNACREIVGLSERNAFRTGALRMVTLVIIAWGVRSSFEMTFGSKLMLSYSLDMWDFNESTLGFFLNYGSIVGLFAATVHYGLMLAKKAK